ncbi:ADP ribosylation factor like GTPase 3, like 1 isoform X2 [Notolabrus celidotus]|uniref:ADP ribosylation factor like GTPase 3, like 1 isoform X2 n=2 Tax=Notolabrus celidotus TaxID=1203425 RepID=UPI00148FEDBE|nr:ADP ribosylation factor like GTPase 3, like 1 isoform X2 [Notolabrus celidotus]
MAMKVIFLCFLIVLQLTACFCSLCFTAQCLMCNSTVQTLNESQVPAGCKKDFQVTINSTGSEAQEGDEVTLTCVHNLPNVTLMFGWMKQLDELLKGKNKSQLVLEKLMTDKEGQYSCFVNSSCGNYESLPHSVTVSSSGVMVLIVCGVSALALVLIMGITMKYKLKRDNAKHRERMRQREQDQQSAGPAPFTPRES